MTHASLLASVAPGAGPTSGGLWPLFMQSFDLFTVLLLAGSLAGVALIVLCVIEIRQRAIAPEGLMVRTLDLVKGGRFEDALAAVREDRSLYARIVRAALERRGATRASIREAAELAASEESARWFRKIEPLNIIGNLGPLVGLAGTVWGMILAFTSLGDTQGQAGPADLSLGISKALFHTLLGLCLAIPCLLAFGLYRGIIDRHCTRAMVAAGEVVERVPSSDEGKG